MMWGFNEFLFDPQFVSHASAEATIRISVLSALRESKTDKAISLLETMLDGDLISLSVLPPERLDSQTISIVQRASAYREKYPHSSSFPDVDTQTSAFLAKYRANSSKQNK